MASRFQEVSAFKLYVCPVTAFNKTTLKEEFSQYGEVVDLYMAEPKETGFNWAFIYFATEEGMQTAIREVEADNKHNFKLSIARPKIFPPPASVAANTSFGAKMMNGITNGNSVSYVAPPNCVQCKKLTFQQCVLCKNPFCDTECSLNGWKLHTSSCVKVAELVKMSDSNGVVGNALAPTVVNFMKDCKSAKKKFTTNEFAEACNRSMVAVSPPVPKESQSVDEFENPSSNKQPQSNGTTSFQKSSHPFSEDDEVDSWGTSDKPSTKPSYKTYNKHNSVANRRQNRRNVTDNEDADENSKEKTLPARPFTKKYSRDADKEEAIASTSRNGYRGDDKRSDFKKKSNESRHPFATKERRINTRVPETDLKLKDGDSVPVVVTTTVDSSVFYVANSDKMVDVLSEIDKCWANCPELKTVEINTLCLAFFEGGWYRAKVLSVDPIEVEYIDYGNKAFREIGDLKELPASLKKYLPLSTKVKLSDGNCQEGKINDNDEIDIFIHKYDHINNVFIVDKL